MAKKNPVNITEASESHEADILSRETRYLIAMAVRVVCFILAIAVHGWLRWVFAIGAVILPWIAVLIANNRAEPKRESSANFTDVGDDAEIGQDRPAPPGESDDDVVFGEIVRPLERGRDGRTEDGHTHRDGGEHDD